MLYNIPGVCVCGVCVVCVCVVRVCVVYVCVCGWEVYNSGRGDWRRERGARVCTHNLCACVRKVRGCDQVFGEDVYCKDEKGVLIIAVPLSSRVTHTVSQKSRWQLCVRAA